MCDYMATVFCLCYPWFMLVWWCFSSDLKWRNLVYVEELSKNSNRIGGIEKPWTCPYCEVYGFVFRYQNLMKLILYEIRHLELSNHINYKAIGSVLSEIWIFEVNFRFLPLVLTKLGVARHNSPFTTSNWVKLIILER